MVADDYSKCPSCKSPALYSQLIELAEEKANCYMCDFPLTDLSGQFQKFSKSEVKKMLDGSDDEKTAIGAK